ncbi:MAG: ABC transporter substrate-binding protein [Peptococcaceae bacterium]|nr:ABC transporter substrate-binding protein [Peptococcaceae bacterium]
MACSATYVGELAELNLLDSLRGVTASEQYWYIPEVKNAMNCGTIKYLGGDKMEAPDYELIKALNPDMVFAYTGAYGQQYIMRKLDEIGVHYAINNEYMEPDFLGRMEWIKFTAAFYNKELEAEKMFNDAVKRINDVTAKVAGLEKPEVAWGLSWGGKVYVENPDSYVGKWITMCGGDYVFKNMGKGYDTQVSMEDFYADAKNADVLIFSSTTNYMRNPSIEEIIQENPLFANIKAVQNGNVWAYAPDWWQVAHAPIFS